MAEAIHLAHLPPNLLLYVSLYESVQNAVFLREQLLAGNRDFEYAFIDASMIISRRHLLAACFRAVSDFLRGRLKSRNVHSEIVFSLSGNNNIGEAFQKFGVQPSTTNVIAVKVATHLDHEGSDATTPVTQESVQNHLEASIQGTRVTFDDDALARMCDLGRIKKVYKISPSAPVSTDPLRSKADGDEERVSSYCDQRERERIERAAVGAIALRGAK